ncbi:hypothetical protein F503_08699 [Ophiostoma piceae UAMH 11346]|uniref:Protein kinase domain-containing protein n=1 Tax=Ophiostoma piceae (strain UAMH 11346) TaxID=1262450 RepID=S3CR16_OPHP1|nr:hypothetical protein F503_08699 [Ophiostoma piceae UAMH 11346]
MLLGSDNTTPVPYQPGTSLQLQVLGSGCTPPLPRSVSAVINKTYSFTMSSVMDVSIHTLSGTSMHAVLKLYDRRFGTGLRRINGQYAPHTAADEEAFQSFMRQPESAVFLRSFEEEKRTALIPPAASDLHDGTPEGTAQYEAALWQECCEYFDCETEAYERLRALQGTSVPRMYAHVCLAPPSADTAPPDPIQSPQTTHYLEVRGILLEPVPGSAMWDWAISPLSSFDPVMWQAVVQFAVDAAHEINRRGIIMRDCGPRNVVVDERSQKPFIIDLAQCYFKEKLIAACETIRDEDASDQEDQVDGEDGDDEEWDLEAEYWERVRSSDNPGAIGSVMVTILLKEKGLTLDITYPGREHEILMLSTATRPT